MSTFASIWPPQRRPRRSLLGVQALAALLLVMLPFAMARAQIFSNPAPISIPSSGTATPYPSTINVSGVPSGILSIRVRLKNFTHTYPADVGVLLVSPDGLAAQLIAPIPTSSGFPVSNITVELSTTSSTPLPNPLVSGSFRAADGTQTYNSPANGFLRVPFTDLRLAAANGAWSLFVQDFAAGDFGSFAGGWEIEFFEEPVPLASNAFTYQGRLDGGITDGSIDVRFSLWNSPISRSPTNRLTSPVQIDNIPISGGLFTASVNLGRAIPTDVRSYLQLEVASPSGSGFETLSTRQEITPAPLASMATGLGNFTSLPGGNSVISGPQGVLQTGSLTLRAPGAVVTDPSGSQGGLLRLVAGNANIGATPPSEGTSASNDVHIIAGDNVFDLFNFDRWNGNIQFFAGDEQPERMRIVGDNGFVGIGTTTPTQRLDVRGSIALGNNGELRAPGGEENLRMLRGRVDFSGAVTGGSGFTAVRTGIGAYTVTFNTPFPGGPPNLPIVTVTAVSSTARYAHTSGTTNSSVSYNVRDALGNLVDSNVTFIVLGPR